MLEQPDLQEETISACLQHEYGLQVTHVAFLPLGADLNTAVYRALTEDQIAYFVKVRRGLFDETSVTLPKFLSDQGIRQIIAPLATKTGQLWADLAAFKLILYPFVAGHNGYEVDLSDQQWVDLGTALKRIHTAVVPPALANGIQQETYAPQAHATVKMFVERVATEAFDDPVAVEVAALLHTRRSQILDLVARAERLGLALRTQPPAFVVCHADLHAGNILIDSSDEFYIVDWDNPIFAPKERDMMVAGSGLMGAWRTPQVEEALFYQGYGSTQVDHSALAYYRYERIVQDIAAYCEQLLLTDEGGEDREQSLRYLASNFLPNNTIAIAYASDKTAKR